MLREREREREREKNRKRELLNLLKESDDEYDSRLDGTDVRFKRHHNYHSEVWRYDKNEKTRFGRLCWLFFFSRKISSVYKIL